MPRPDLRPETAGALLVSGARLFDPASRLDRTADLLVAGGKVRAVGPSASEGFEGRRLDGAGLVVVPGFFDMHTHLREPGREDEETVETGAAAAAAGGFTGIACMPNTAPVLDDRSHVEFVIDRARGLVTAVHPVAAVTLGLKGQELAEMGECAAAGAVAFSDDGAPVASAGLLRRALDYAGQFDRPVIDHCEDRSLAEGGQMHEGFVSTRLGLRGIPAAAESVAVARDLLVAEITRGRLHLAHVSTAASVRLIRDAKARGLKVSAETCPHYLVLTDEAVGAYDTQAKMNPPLRAGADRDALWEGLRDGTIDAVATDHAPHSVEEKDAEFDAAPFGILGLETAVGLLLTHGVRDGRITLADLVRACSSAPRSVLGLPAAAIAPGAAADLTLLAPDRSWTVDRDAFLSKSRNTPFHGWTLHGAAAGVIRGERMFLNP